MKGKRSPSSLAKLSVPGGGPPVGRPRLFRKLDRALASFRLVWVTGRPGAGKTTLAATYLRARRRPTLWYALDSGDRDLATLFRYLSIGSRDVGRKSGRSLQSSLPPLTPERRLGLDAFARSFFEQLGERMAPSAVLVLDNHHVLGELEQVTDVLLEGMSYLREGQRIVVLSRRPPPPALASAEASGLVARFGEEDLDFIPSETAALVRARCGNVRPRPGVDALHRVARGWAAGLVMLIEGGWARGATPGTPEVVRDYLAREYLDGLPGETRDMLERVAFAPLVTAAIATALGVPSAPALLAGLARRGAFVTSGKGTTPSYEVHPMVRELVLARILASLPADALVDLRRRTAEVCAAEGDLETAIALHAANQSWEEIAQLADAVAPRLVEHGQVETLQRWLELLPGQFPETRGSLAYWLGTCASGRLPAVAEMWFLRARDLFAASGHWLRSLDAWAGATINLIVSFDDLRALEARLAEFDELVPPTRLTEVRSHWVIGAFLCAANYRSYAHPRACEVAAHGRQLLEHEPGEAGAIAFLSYALVSSFAQRGEMAAMRAVAEAATRLRYGGLNPVWEIHRCATESYVALHTADFTSCRRAVAMGLSLASKHGIPMWTHVLTAIAATTALVEGELTNAQGYLTSIATALPPGVARLAHAHHSYLAALASLLAGEPALALEQAKSALRRTALLGAVYPEMQCRLLLAEIHVACGEPSEAESDLEPVEAMLASSKSLLLAAHLHFVRVGIAVSRADAGRLIMHLREALALARRGGPALLLSAAVPPRSFGSFCAHALAEGIEVELVHELLRARTTGDFQPDATLEMWPWSVRVQILGRFSVQIAGVTLAPAGKQQTRVLELFELLVVDGGAASEARVSDCLWPDADGDKARQALAITVHRLRALLGDGALVVRRAGSVSLNRARIFADVWALQAILQQIATAESAGDQKLARRLRARAAALYSGPPCPVRAGSSPSWLIAAQVGLRDRVRKCGWLEDQAASSA